MLVRLIALCSAPMRRYHRPLMVTTIIIVMTMCAAMMDRRHGSHDSTKRARHLWMSSVASGRPGGAAGTMAKRLVISVLCGGIPVHHWQFFRCASHSCELYLYAASRKCQ